MSNEQRTAIYGAVSALLGAAGTFGLITADEAEVYALAAAALLGAVTQLVSAVKTWKQRGSEAKMLLRFDGTNAENVAAFTEALNRFRGSSLS